ncbi:coiled-coil domain-containing protein, partial [Helicobacter felis]
KRYADREATLTQEKQELETSNAELNKENDKLARINTIIGRQRDNLQQQKQELEANNKELLATLTTTLTDLTDFVVPHNKKLTINEIKPLLENVRLQWKDINQRLGEVKIFTQGDYKALRALKDEGLNIDDLKKRIVALEQEAKEHKDHLSPKAVQELKQKHAEALEAKDTKHAEAVKDLKDQHSKELDEAKQEITTLKTANANLETAHAKLTQERGKAISQLDSATKTAQELTDAKTKAETALANLQTTHKALESKYSTLETSQTSNTQEIEELNTAHAKAVEELKTASALKDKQITELTQQNTELTAQKQEAEQKASSLEKEIEALRKSQYVVNVYANSQLKNSLNDERFFAKARHQGHPIVGFLVGRHICYFALKNPEWEDLEGSGLFLGRAEKPDYEALLLETIKRYYAKLLDWVGGNNVLEGVGWKDGLEIVERDDDKGIGGLSVGGDVDLATAIEKCYDYDRLAHWQEKDGGGILESVRIPPPAFKAFETRIAPVWFKPRLEGLNIRLYDFLGKDLPQIDVVAFKDDWGLMRETMDYIASLNRQKLRDTHKEKRQQHAKGWYARSVEKRVKQRAREQAKQLKTNTPTPSKSKPTPKPTEPQKSPQPTQSTTPKKPWNM